MDLRRLSIQTCSLMQVTNQRGAAPLEIGNEFLFHCYLFPVPSVPCDNMLVGENFLLLLQLICGVSARPSHFCAFTGIAIRASMPPMMSIFIYFFIISVHFVNKVVSVNVNDCEQLWFDPVA